VRWCVLLLVAACGGEDQTPFWDPETCEPVALVEGNVAERAACDFDLGDRTERSLGIGRGEAQRIPITHVVIRMQENRSFDHFLGTLGGDVDGIPEGALNMDLGGASVPAFHLDSTCLEADPPHQWEAMNAQWNGGAMDGFVTTAAVDGSDGHYVMGHYTEDDLPFYHWLARTFAIGDRYFSSSLGGTWSNRNFLYTGAAHGVRSTFDAVIREAPTLFDQLDAAGVEWAVYLEGTGAPRQDTLGWTRMTPGVRDYSELLARLRDGTLPPVSFVETSPGAARDEHPPYDVQPGESLSRELYEAARQSPLWPRLAMFFNYDTAGGLYDHVAPPEACVPLEDPAFDRYGLRVPFHVVSPWVKPGHVSHEVHDHTSVVRFVQLLHHLPALSRRDANATALLDFFAFDCAPDLLDAPESPTSGVGGCPME